MQNHIKKRAPKLFVPFIVIYILFTNCGMVVASPTINDFFTSKPLEKLKQDALQVESFTTFFQTYNVYDWESPYSYLWEDCLINEGSSLAVTYLDKEIIAGYIDFLAMDRSYFLIDLQKNIASFFYDESDNAYTGFWISYIRLYDLNSGKLIMQIDLCKNFLNYSAGATEFNQRTFTGFVYTLKDQGFAKLKFQLDVERGDLLVEMQDMVFEGLACNKLGLGINEWRDLYELLISKALLNVSELESVDKVPQLPYNTNCK